jgi:hypothetical protein
MVTQACALPMAIHYRTYSCFCDACVGGELTGCANSASGHIPQWQHKIVEQTPYEPLISRETNSAKVLRLIEKLLSFSDVLKFYFCLGWVENRQQPAILCLSHLKAFVLFELLIFIQSLLNPPANMRWEKYTKVDYALDNRASLARSAQRRIQLCNAPTVTVPKLQFKVVHTTKEDFLIQFEEMAPSTFQHHQLERNQREVYSHTHFALLFGMIQLHMDYAENIKLILLQQRFELFQTQTPISRTCFPCYLSCHHSLVSLFQSSRLLLHDPAGTSPNYCKFYSSIDF